MQNINWEMMTQFVFPEDLGIVEEVISVNIKPRWQQVETDESVRLVGIYHITAVVRFNPSHLPQYCEGTLIEHLEFNGNDGYFEYALPLEVDLPREKIAQLNKPELFVDNVNFFVYDGSSCTFKWETSCAYEEAESLFEHHPNEQQTYEPPHFSKLETVEKIESSTSSSSNNHQAYELKENTAPIVEQLDEDYENIDPTIDNSLEIDYTAPSITNELVSENAAEPSVTNELAPEYTEPKVEQVLEQEAAEPNVEQELEQEAAKPNVEQELKIEYTEPKVEQDVELEYTEPKVEQDLELEYTEPKVEQDLEIEYTEPKLNEELEIQYTEHNREKELEVLFSELEKENKRLLDNKDSIKFEQDQPLELDYSEVKINHNDIVEIIDVKDHSSNDLTTVSVPSPYDHDDFFTDLTENYTLLDLRSNKIGEE